MNAPFDPALLAAEKFAVGQPVSREEDLVLLRGEGRYTDDLNRPGQLYGVMLPSRVAHGKLLRLDTDAARQKLGVWPSVQNHVANAADVLTAVTYASRKEVALAIVFDTDARLDPGVTVVGIFPSDTWPA